jgi:hypothetical protein
VTFECSRVSRPAIAPNGTSNTPSPSLAVVKSPTFFHYFLLFDAFYIGPLCKWQIKFFEARATCTKWVTRGGPLRDSERRARHATGAPVPTSKHTKVITSTRERNRAALPYICAHRVDSLLRFAFASLCSAYDVVVVDFFLCLMSS